MTTLRLTELWLLATCGELPPLVSVQDGLSVLQREKIYLIHYDITVDGYRAVLYPKDEPIPRECCWETTKEIAEKLWRSELKYIPCWTGNEVIGDIEKKIMELPELPVKVEP